MLRTLLLGAVLAINGRPGVSHVSMIRNDIRTSSILTGALMQMAPVAPAKPAPVEDPVVTALALKIYRQMRAGKVDPGLLTSAMAAALSPDKLAQVQPVFTQLGEPVKLVLDDRAESADGVAYQYLATLATASFMSASSWRRAKRSAATWSRRRHGWAQPSAGSGPRTGPFGCASFTALPVRADS